MAWNRHLLPGAIGDPFRALAAGDLLDRSHEFIANNSHLSRMIDRGLMNGGIDSFRSPKLRQVTP